MASHCLVVMVIRCMVVMHTYRSRIARVASNQILASDWLRADTTLVALRTLKQ